MYILLKFGLSALIIVAVSEIAKRSSLLGALIASLPLTSILALTWLYLDTKDIEKISTLSTDILWLVIPSLVFFMVLPIVLRAGMNYYGGLAVSIVTMLVAYGAALGLRRLIS